MENGDTGTVKRKRGRPKGAKDKKKRADYTVSSKALAQRRNNVTVRPAETDEEKAYNARQIEHMLRIQEIAQNADRNDILSLKSCFFAYMRLCQEDGFKVSNMAAYAAMGMSNMTFETLKNKDDPEAKKFYQMVKTMCAISRETLISENKLNPVIGIFWQRNYDGLRNDTEQVQAIQEQNDSENSGGNAYKEKYRNLIGE